MKLKSLISIALLLSTSIVNAEPISYFGAGYANGYYTEPGLETFTPSMIVFRGGTKFTNTLAVEGRGGIGLSDDTRILFGIPITLSIDSLYGIYAIGSAPVSANLSLYGVVGFTQASGKATVPGTSIVVSSTESSASFGFGADIATSANAKLNIEYMQYINVSAYDFNALSIGATVQF